MAREEVELNVLPHVRDSLFDKARQAISYLPLTAFDATSPFDYVEFTKLAYHGDVLTISNRIRVKAFVLAAFAEKRLRAYLEDKDRETFYAHHDNLVRDAFGSIDIFHCLTDEQWREITEFAVRVSIMKAFMAKPNTHLMRIGGAFSIGVTSPSLIGGNPSRRSRRLVHVLHSELAVV